MWDFPTLCQERRYFCLYLFICIREPSLCDLVSIRKREDPGNECLCVVALFDSGVVIWRIISTCFLAAISLQGKEKSSSLLTFLYCVERVLPAIIF